MARAQHTESLLTTEESAFLRLDTSIFAQMVEVETGRNNAHLMEDQDLLWELFERHHFVKSSIRMGESLIEEMPQLRGEDWEKRETLKLRRRNSPSKRPI